VWKQGPSTTLQWVLEDLNQKHLSPRVSTIHETLKRAGLRSGSINLLVHRGFVTHRAPLLERTLKGPDLLALGPILSEPGVGTFFQRKRLPRSRHLANRQAVASPESSARFF